MPVLDGESEHQKNEEAPESEKKCNLGELPMRNSYNKREIGIDIVGNLDELEMLEIIERPLDNRNLENLIEIEDDAED